MGNKRSPRPPTRLADIGALYQRRGTKLERITVLDASNSGTAIWRINLDPGLRAIGIYYGHCRASVEGSQVGEFGVVGAARGRISDGGAVNRVAVAHTDRVARTALVSLAPIKVRHRERIGRPRPIAILTLVDAVCWLDMPLVTVARQHGWRVGSRQRSRLRDALIGGLEEIEQAWSDAGIRIPGNLADIEAG